MNEDFWDTDFWASGFWAEGFWSTSETPGGGGEDTDGYDGMTEDEFRRYRKIVTSNIRRD